MVLPVWEGHGEAVHCNCAEGFTGSHCETDLDYCRADYCQNNGTCMEGVGTNVTCNCPQTFEGDRCQTLFCPVGYCNGRGSCSVNVTLNRVRCMCDLCFTGDRCETDVNTCELSTCQNGGTCTDGIGCDLSCECPPEYTGQFCEVPLCYSGYCSNGGNCSVVGVNRMCSCPQGFSGDTCQSVVCVANVSCANGGQCNVVNNNITCTCLAGFTGLTCIGDLSVCAEDMPCQNGGTCQDGLGLDYHCICPDSFGGPECDVPLPCSPNPCQNGGNCTQGSGNTYTCACPNNFSGPDCESMVSNNCSADSDCSNSTYCYFRCSSDDYPSHSAFLSEPVELKGVSFVSVEPSKFPSFTQSFTLFAVFNQTNRNRGYLAFYGTSGVARNYAVFLDHNNSIIWFYYTNTSGHPRNFSVAANWTSDEVHQLVVTYSHTSDIANFYLNGTMLPKGVKTLYNPNFNYGVSDILTL